MNRLLVVDPSTSQQLLIARLAAAAGLVVQACTGEQQALKLLESDTSLVAMLVADQLDEGDSLHLLDALRLLPHRVTLPIGFLTTERNPALAQHALRIGATEVFLRAESDSLATFIAEWADLSNHIHLSGRALLVEDSDFHAQYTANLCREMGIEVDRAADVDGAIGLLRSGSYQIAIVDIVLNGTKSGIALVRHIRQEMASALPVLIVSGFDDAPRRLMALTSGADDLLGKPFIPEEFIWRVRQLMQRAVHEDNGKPAVGAGGSGDWNGYALSVREKQICDALLKGSSDKKIAADLGISFWTVRSHVQRIFAKTGVYNRRELMARFITSPASPMAG